ncbi:MAG: hypothetical protein ACN6OP_10305 [Pseudomonadales bacterium]
MQCLFQHGLDQGTHMLAKTFHSPNNVATAHTSSGGDPVASGSDALLPTMRAMVWIA